MPLLSTWCCPSCRGRLDGTATTHLTCTECSARYEVVAGIPDLRVSEAAWIDLDEDREAARRLDRDSRGLSVEAMIRQVFAAQPGRTPETIEARTREVVGAPAKLASQLEGWLRSSASRQGFVDLGCGPGQLLAAAAQRGVHGTGIDVSLVWLTVARRMIESHGGRANLAAAFGESLPLLDRTAPAVISLDVIEHVGDQRRYLAEIDRVLDDGAPVALSTPNRFSLAAEPHVGVWGVGLLPHALQDRYVRWRTGRPYEFVRLLSVPGLASLLRRRTRIAGRFIVPQISDEEIAHFSARRVALARAYNRVAGSALLRWPLLAVGPFFRYTGVKSPSGAERAPRSPATTEFAIPIVR